MCSNDELRKDGEDFWNFEINLKSQGREEVEKLWLVRGTGFIKFFCVKQF